MGIERQKQVKEVDSRLEDDAGLRIGIRRQKNEVREESKRKRCRDQDRCEIEFRWREWKPRRLLLMGVVQSKKGASRGE
jgi:hypothetical protein